jgi:hypothetical protein
MSVEAVGTIASGVAAQSIGLTAFGIDSLIALASGEQRAGDRGVTQLQVSNIFNAIKYEEESS